VIGSERPVLAVVEKIALASPADPYLPLKALADYSGMSRRWLRDRLTDPHHPLPCYRLPPSGKVVVRRSEYDTWVAPYRQVGRPDVGRIVDDMLSGLREAPKLSA
jgi:hypothetical protein